MNETAEQTCNKCGLHLSPRERLVGCPRCLLAMVGATPSKYRLEGSIFGNYLIRNEIAKGGMGVVYLAENTVDDRTVALKMIRSFHLADEVEVQRFLREAKTAAGLDHPAIVPVYEVGMEEGQYFFTMKYLEGGSLRDRMESGAPRMKDREIAILIQTIARALEAAHRKNVLHRDLKPSNILFDHHGQPYLTDFGLAKHLHDDLQITLSDRVLGTAPYMSPEQAAGKSSLVDQRTDIWALGVILYQLLTGSLPFEGSNQLEILKNIQEEEPKPIAPPGKADPGLESIALKCLRKRLGERYASAGELADEVQNWLEHKPIRARADLPWQRWVKWARRSPIKVAILVGIGIGAMASGMLSYRAGLNIRPQYLIQHNIMTSNHEGVFFLKVIPYKDDRISHNILRLGFEGDRGQWVRLNFLEMPTDVVQGLKVRIRVDQPGRPDPFASGILTNGQEFFLRIADNVPGNFYLASVGWSATNLLASHKYATATLTLLSNRINYVTMEVVEGKHPPP